MSALKTIPVLLQYKQSGLSLEQRSFALRHELQAKPSNGPRACCKLRSGGPFSDGPFSICTGLTSDIISDDAFTKS
jgi:hypothetical protein